MAPLRSFRRILIASVGLLTVGGIFAACGGGAASAKPQVSGLLSFNIRDAVFANDPIERADQRFACGTRDFSFGQELITLDNPALARVQDQWGDVVPGKSVYMTGTVTDVQGGVGTDLRGGADFLLTHPFGTDFTFETVLDKPFKELAMTVGALPLTPIPPGQLHTELEKGVIPHLDQTTYLPGFLPVEGDQVALFGRWIVDCGHNDFHTEMHPPSLVSVAEMQAGSTVMHSFYYPYQVTELYNPDSTEVADLTNTARYADPKTRTLPAYFVDELIRIINGEHDRIQAHILMKAPPVEPQTWYACAPAPRPAGAKLATSYQFTVRPGIDVQVTPDDDLGCTRFDLKVGPGYQPLNPTRFDCSIPWTQLTPQLQQALGNDEIDILSLIKSKVGADLATQVERDPVFDCYDPLVVSAPGPASGSGVVTNADQPYPFYGQASVSWSK
jgi:hypothetical protein